MIITDFKTFKAKCLIIIIDFQKNECRPFGYATGSKDKDAHVGILTSVVMFASRCGSHRDNRQTARVVGAAKEGHGHAREVEFRAAS